MKAILNIPLCLCLLLLTALPAHSQVSFRAASSATSSSSTLTIPKPTGTSVNDVLIAAIGFNNSTASITPPSGWTSVNRMNNPGTTSNSLAIYRRTASGSEPASYAWTVSGGSSFVGGIQAFSGVDPINPIDSQFGQSTASGTIHDTPGLTTTGPNTMIVTAHTFASSQTWTPGAGQTEAYDRPSGSIGATGQSITGTYAPQAQTGSVAPKRATAAGNADRGNTHILALRTPNAAPTVTITSPADGANIARPANFTLAASASDSDGTIAYVDFSVYTCLGETLDLGRITQPPYSISLVDFGYPGTWISPCFYDFSAVATDNGGLTRGTGVQITIVNPPTVSLTSPALNATFNVPANINLQAQASSVDGTVANVKFFRGSTLIATVTSPPFVFAWSGVGQGSYSLTAQVTDSYGITVSSTAIPITVNGGGPQVYYIHVDHLSAPRLVADAAGTTVWKWDQGEPFGNDPANENPSGAGTFDLPLRLPGQYSDKETSRHYNYFRDYDASIGRYTSSDPLGIRAGVNTYAYGNSNPLTYTDPTGEIGVAGFVYGAIAGGVGGYISSGGTWQGALYGGLAGGVVGAINPFAASAAGAAAGGFAASVAGQFIGNLNNPCKDDAFGIDYTQAAIAGLAGGGSKMLFNYLGNTSRSAFTYMVNQSMGPANPVAVASGQAAVRGGISGVAQLGYKNTFLPKDYGCSCKPN